MFTKKSPSKNSPKSPTKSPGKSRPPVGIVKEGWLKKQRKTIKTWSPGYFYLLVDGSLMGFETQTENPFNTKPRNNYTVNGCQTRLKDGPKPYTFAIRGLTTGVTERTFCADSDQDRQEWLGAVEQVKGFLKMSSPSVPGGLQLPSTSSRSNDILLSPGCPNNDPELLSKFESKDEGTGKKKVTFDNFEFLVLLGKGAFAEVSLFREKKSSKLYALKILSKNKVIEMNEIEHTLTENRVLQKTNNHPFLIRYKCSFQTNDRLFFVTEYVNGGDLYFHLRKEKFFTEDRSKFYGAEIVSAIGYLHKKKIIYRDMKPENLLLDKDGHIKVADFGLCKEITCGATTRTFCGSPEYLAPEILQAKEYGVAVDWWGVGVVLYEMMIGRLPFYSKDENIMSLLILMHQVEFPDDTSISIEARNLVRALLVKDSSQRLGAGADDAKELMRHPFFDTINWEDLLEKKIAPPFKPEVTSDTDTRYFDTVFTGDSAELSYADSKNENKDCNPEADAHFDGFSYKCPSSTQSLDP